MTSDLIIELEADALDAARYRWLKKRAHWDDDRDFAPGGRWWLAVLVRDGRPSFDDAVDLERGAEQSREGHR